MPLVLRSRHPQQTHFHHHWGINHGPWRYSSSLGFTYEMFVGARFLIGFEILPYNIRAKVSLFCNSFPVTKLKFV